MVASVTTVTDSSVDTDVSDTTSVTSADSVSVDVVNWAVVASTVMVVGVGSDNCMPKTSEPLAVVEGSALSSRCSLRRDRYTYTGAEGCLVSWLQGPAC